MESADERGRFEARWRSTHLAGATVALGETMRADASAGASAPVPLPRLSLGGDLVLRRRLGEGGMGAVDLAEQRSLGREVAVKRLRDGSSDPEAAAALLREARTAGALEHPGIVPVHALGQDDRGHPVLVMKRVEGVSWADLIADPRHAMWGKLAPDAQDRLGAHVEVLRHVCNALEFAHSRGVIHRDIKPDNVMIGAFGEVYLLDWGIALHRAGLGESNPMVGTPCFMAPEMIGGPVSAHDERTDVYLLGATLHAVLTGRVRHEGSTLHAVMLAAWLSEPVRYGAAVPEELAELCNSATHRDPDRRPASAAAFRQRLAEYVLHRGSMALARSARATLDRARQMEGDVAWRTISEARFGFAQAVRDWPGNSFAQHGVQEAIEALIERELAVRSADGARALIDELPEPRPALSEKLARLESEIAAEKREAEKGRHETRESDKSVAAVARTVLVVSAAAFSAVVSIAYALVTDDRDDARQIVLMDALMLAVVIPVAWVVRRRLFGNRISRQLASTMLILMPVICLGDAVAWRLGGALPQIIAQRCVVSSGVFAIAALALERGLWVTAGAVALGAVMVLFVPAWASLVNGLVLLAIVASLVAIAWRQRKRA